MRGVLGLFFGGCFLTTTLTTRGFLPKSFHAEVSRFLSFGVSSRAIPLPKAKGAPKAITGKVKDEKNEQDSIEAPHKSQSRSRPSQLRMAGPKLGCHLNLHECNCCAAMSAGATCSSRMGGRANSRLQEVLLISHFCQSFVGRLGDLA